LKKSSNLLIIFLFLIAGCVAQSKVQTEGDFQIKKYRTVNVNVLSQMPVCERECQEEIEKLKNSLVENLKQADLFENVGSEITDSELIINVRITELLRVTSKDRFWLGAAAGRAKVTGTVELFDTYQNKIIGTFLVEGQSSGGTVFAGGTQQAIEKFVEQLVHFMHEKIII